MTRAGDTFVDLEERAAMANRAGAHLFVSLHADAAKDTSVRGFTVYVSRSAGGDTLHAAEVLAAALSGQGIPSRGVRRADYRVLVKTRMPAVLVEAGFLSNPAEASLLVSDAVQQRIAASLAAGVEKVLTGR